MGLAGDGKEAREGLRMGLWGAAQAVAFALGGLVATIGSDLARHLLGTPAAAYATVFAGEAILFLFAARLAAGVFPNRAGAAKRLRDVPRPDRRSGDRTGIDDAAVRGVRCRGRWRRSGRCDRRGRSGAQRPFGAAAR
jgi:hypothetical protein